MNRTAFGLLAFALLLLPASGALAQASSLANCKYYTKVQQDFEQGLPHCEDAIRENPEDAEARFYGAWCLAEMGKLAEAWESFHWLIERKDDGDKKVRKHAEMAEKRVATFYQTFFNKGVELLDAEDTEAAREEFLKATRIDPREANAHLNLGFTQVQLGDLDGALESFEAAVQAEPDSLTGWKYLWDALGRKVQQLRGSEEPDSARIADVSSRLREVLDKVLELDPSEADAHLQLADLDFAAGESEKAIEHVRQAIEIAPKAVVNLFNMAVQFYQNDEYTPAIQAFKTVLAQVTEPTDQVWEKATWVLGLCYIYTEENDKALERFEQLLEHYPDEIDYWEKAVYAASKSGQKEKASEYFRTLEEMKEKAILGE